MRKRILASAALAMLVAGSVGMRSTMSPPATAADHPGMVPIPLDAPATERHVYPPSVRVGDFDGAYKLATLYTSALTAGHRVALWESEAGVLKSEAYPVDEFIYVLEGEVVTTDADGTRREFRAGDAFVLPRGWTGTWDMKTRFRKLIVNF
jgi:uncharacterized cupin superfamily protein